MGSVQVSSAPVIWFGFGLFGPDLLWITVSAFLQQLLVQLDSNGDFALTSVRTRQQSEAGRVYFQLILI
jgi:hypothetical protein